MRIYLCKQFGEIMLPGFLGKEVRAAGKMREEAKQGYSFSKSFSLRLIIKVSLEHKMQFVQLEGNIDLGFYNLVHSTMALPPRRTNSQANFLLSTSSSQRLL